MTAHHNADGVSLVQADCIDFMRTLPDNCVDSIVTDPPYGLGFMGKGWDDLPPGLDWAVECLRVLKPGGHLLAFGGTRTWHRLAVAVEDAGFEVRDSIAWLYGSGFPKSLDVSKAIDKLDAATERTERAFRFTGWMRQHLSAKQIDEATGTAMGNHYTTHPTQPSVATVAHLDILRPLLPAIPGWVEDLVADRVVESDNYNQRPPAEYANGVGMAESWTEGKGWNGKDARGGQGTTAEARAWQGWGTALKPAFEPIVVARKPLIGTVAANVLAHGTGGLNVDACRIGETVETWPTSRGPNTRNSMSGGVMAATETGAAPPGRWPANVILDDRQADALDQQSGTLKSGANPSRRGIDGDRTAYGTFGGQEDARPARGADSGGASRFFYVAKAPTKERPKVDGVAHPTVKPLALMRWLVKLVTPPGGLVLEPFAGSGTTVEACILEGFRCLAIERETEYLPLILDRITRAKGEAA